MRKFTWFVLGMLTLLLGFIAAGAILLADSHGFSARENPTNLEKWAARLIRNYSIPADAKAAQNPVPLTPEVLDQARAHWADHCAVCHANDGSGDVLMGRNMYPHAPDMRTSDTQHLTDGQLFYIIQNGVRLTGMPAWGTPGSSHDDEDSWKLVHFIRHLPSLTFEEKKQMEKLNPKGPEDLKEEEEEQRFLNGEDTDATQHEHHHH